MSKTVDKDLYFVAVKLLIWDGNKLLITHDVFGSWDIPGGRIKVDEFDKSLNLVIDRKVKEELGTDIELEIGKPVIFFRHERVEHSTGEEVRIFAVGYEATFIGGTIHLGKHHDQFEWVDLTTLQPEAYFAGGWLVGIKEYQGSIF